jgi:hypothetical protein
MNEPRSGQPREAATLWRLPSKSTEFEEGPRLTHERDRLTSDQIDAHDQLVEIQNSSWLGELLTDRRYDAPGLRHLRIYLDDVGYLEVAATSFTPPPERST